jgi:dihydroorotase
MKSILIKNGVIYKDQKFIKRDILCSNKLITRIEENINIVEHDTEIIDAHNLIVSPGFIDLHTHLREPGFEYKETIETGTMAALAGGFTCVCAMPNLNPAPDCLDNLQIEKNIIKQKAKCDVLTYMSITKNRLGNEIICFDDIKDHCIGISDDGNGIENIAVMMNAMRCASEKNILISAHCEDKKIPSNHKILIGNKKHYLNVQQNASEYEQIKRDLKLLEKYQTRYHVCHVSTKESIDLIKLAKEKKLKVTCEVTPHHLLLSEKDITCDNGRFKMSPPLRSRCDQEALIKALQNNLIDCIATDHAPHSKKEKDTCFEKSLMGVTGLECAFAVLNTFLVKTNIISIEKLLELITIKPYKIINVHYDINIGATANLTIIDLNKKWSIDSKKFFSKGHSTPFDKNKVIGKVILTIMHGLIAYKDDTELCRRIILSH